MDQTRIDDIASRIRLVRQDLHRHPELQFDLPRTSELVASRLRDMGCDEVVTGLAQTGVVATIRGRGTASDRRIGLRADMDALPIDERTNLPHHSANTGRMHACGHDGHTAMLLGAAEYLAATRDFDGTAVLVFQPAEEGGGGGKHMIDEGLFQRFPVDEIYALHNKPGLPIGHFAIRPGPMMASTDRFRILVEGRGAHAARPQDGNDALLAACQIVTALNTIVSRNIDPQEAAVVTVTRISGGNSYNVIPDSVEIWGTCRTFSPKVRQRIMDRIETITRQIPAGYDLSATLSQQGGYPSLVNHDDQVGFASGVVRDLFGPQVLSTSQPAMGAEDFAFMLECRPGAYMLIGNGDSAPLHNAAYDFSDDALPWGMAYFVGLIERGMPL